MKEEEVGPFPAKRPPVMSFRLIKTSEGNPSISANANTFLREVKDGIEVYHAVGGRYFRVPTANIERVFYQHHG